MERKIIEYKIVWDTCRDGFEETINLYLSEGWQLFGNIVVIRKRPLDFLQTMVKYE